MVNKEIVVIGGGPAGICAAISAAKSGANVLLLERNFVLGGQLVKQTHMFFGSEKQYASHRGINITDFLLKELDKYKENIEIWTDSTVLAIYKDKVITVLKNDKYIKIKSKSIIVATGASEKVLAFENNDLPGVYGAGAVQTLMNVYGVKPGNRVLMVGSGNIGLIVSYQLMQAGVKVVGVLEAASQIGGYLVHASKLRRLGVKIYPCYSVKKAIGQDNVEKIIAWKLDENWEGINGSELEFDVDVVCISVGLSPLTELLSQVGCKMKYVRELSGLVPIINKKHETTVENIFVAGDVSGIEEASSAMVEGYITGLNAASKIGFKHVDYDSLLEDYHEQLRLLRSGLVGERILQGIEKIMR